MGYSQASLHEIYIAQFMRFQEARSGTTALPFEFELWPILVANIESCNEILIASDQLQMEPIIRQGFINRYTSVSQSLDAHINMTLEELINIGTHTVSVIPVLSYFVGIVAEKLYPQPELKELIADGSLEDAMTTAATIVRLLNDIGAAVTYSTGKRASLLHTLWKSYESKPMNVQTITELLCHVSSDTPALTRFQKDILYGEFNICLHNLAFTESIEYGISVFGENLAYFAQRYRQSHMRLRDTLAAIDRKLQNTMISELIGGFISFHEKIYTHRFDSVAGEYVA